VVIPPFGFSGRSTVGIDAPGSIGAGTANNCPNPLLDPGNAFSFVFGTPVSFGIDLETFSSGTGAPSDSSGAGFGGFNVSQVVVNSSGGPSFQPFPAATWNLVDLSVPEPGTAGLLGFTLAGLFFALRSSVSSESARSPVIARVK
jgi:hypothetical protein